MIWKDQNDRTKALIKNLKNSPKRFYGYMRKLQTVNKAVSQLKVKDGSRVTSTDEEAAQVLCDYFQQVFTREEQEFNPSTIYQEEQLPIKFAVETVLKKLKQLKTDK